MDPEDPTGGISPLQLALKSRKVHDEHNKTEDEFFREIAELRRQNAEFKRSESEHKLAEKKIREQNASPAPPK